MSFIIITFYKFVSIEDCVNLQFKLKKFCSDNKIKGTILLSEEGVNGTVSGEKKSIDAFYEFIKTISFLSDMEFKESVAEYVPFSKLKIKIKNEIIKFDKSLDLSLVGKHLDSEEWNKLIADEKTITIDTRNDYEIVFGTFKNAINPKTRNFTDLPEWVEKNLKSVDKETPIAMFCTGGVRCEKSTAYMKKIGFKHVYHLNGGILKYLEDMQAKPQEENLWEGKCFVFDDRVAVDKDLKPYANS
jgi:UPF0176 protein